LPAFIADVNSSRGSAPFRLWGIIVEEVRVQQTLGVFNRYVRSIPEPG
jgi:hypothetical protein